MDSVTNFTYFDKSQAKMISTIFSHEMSKFGNTAKGMVVICPNNKDNFSEQKKQRF